MNLRNILKIYTLERQLNPDDIALLNTLRGMNEGERELLVESLAGKVVKKTTKKSSKSSASKSPRAQGLSEAVRSGLQRREPTVGGFADDVNMGLCTAMVDDNGGKMECGQTIDNNVHHKQTDPNYHPFVSSNAAPPAAGRSSSQNDSLDTSLASSRTATEDVSVAAGD